MVKSRYNAPPHTPKKKNPYQVPRTRFDNLYDLEQPRIFLQAHQYRCKLQVSSTGNQTHSMTKYLETRQKKRWHVVEGNIGVQGPPNTQAHLKVGSCDLGKSHRDKVRRRWQHSRSGQVSVVFSLYSHFQLFFFQQITNTSLYIVSSF